MASITPSISFVYAERHPVACAIASRPTFLVCLPLDRRCTGVRGSSDAWHVFDDDTHPDGVADGRLHRSDGRWALCDGAVSRSVVCVQRAAESAPDEDTVELAFDGGERVTLVLCSVKRMFSADRAALKTLTLAFGDAARALRATKEAFAAYAIRTANAALEAPQSE